MKRIVVFFFLLFFSFGIYQPSSAHNGLEAEHIEDFKSQIWIQKDGSIKVLERIEYNFGEDDRHGIFRTIPVIKNNTDNKKYRMDLDVLQVVDEKGDAYQYNTSGGDTISIKIGDPDETITGEHTYIITYTVKGALTYFSDHDELYWNVNGNDWNVPVAEISSTVYLPEGIKKEQIKSACYTGYSGSTETNCAAEAINSQVVIKSTQVLQTGQGLTTVVGFPKGIVSIVEPTEVKEFYTTFWGKVLIVLTIFGLVIWYLLLPIWLPIKWFMSGRDPRGSTGPVRAWFDPPQTTSGRPLTPAETGTLIDEHASIHEISALVVSLAQRGYMKIVEKEKDDYEFVRAKEPDEKLLEFERKFIHDIFSDQKVLRLKDAKIADEVRDVQEQLYISLVKEGYFPENPDKVRKRYAILAGVAAVTFNFILLISATVFGRIMPRKTIEGVHATNIAKSLKNFLTSQERQLEFQAQNQMMFEKLLPFAVAFGVEKVWADRFKDMTFKPPEWYTSNHHGIFNSQSFTRGLSSSMASFSIAATPITSSTGHSSGFSGGSSGGGGGGGGGGSW